jgi:hypothetical protein
MKLNVLLLILMANIPRNATSQNVLNIEHNITHSTTNYSDSIIDQRLMQGQLSAFIDQYEDDAHVHLSTNTGYDLPNPYLISILGSAPAWTRYTYNNIPIDNPLRSGDSRYHFNVHQTELLISNTSNVISLLPKYDGNNLLQTNFSFGSIGNRVGFADWFINNISGHESARQREIFDISLRPKINWQSQLDFHHNNTKYPSRIQLSAGSRKHIDQNFLGKNIGFDENFLTAYAHFVLKKELAADKNESGILLGTKYRSHDMAEFNYALEETRAAYEWHTTYYSNQISTNKKRNFSLHFDFQNFNKNTLNITRNIIDQDGEGLEPYYVDGSQYAITSNYSFSNKIHSNHNLYFKTNMSNSLLAFRPQNSIFRTNLYRQNKAANYLPLNTIEWAANSFNAGLLDNDVSLSYKFYKPDFNLDLEGGIQAMGMILSEKSILEFHPMIDVGVAYCPETGWGIGLKAGFRANRFDINQIQYLSNDHLNGNLYFWSDLNNDRSFTTNEKGMPYANTGGLFREKDNSLGVSKTIYLEMPVTYKNKSGFQLTILPQYRQFRNTWLTEYKGGPENYGNHVPIGDLSLFYLNPSDTKFNVISYPNNRIKGNDNFIFNQPFYAGVTLKSEKSTDNFFISASFTANMVVGASSLGNGPIHNNINVLSESTADPNLLSNNTGRLDADRSFISRWLVGYKLSKKNHITLQIKYKDGQSFANYAHFIRTTPLGNQVAFIQREVRGDNPLTGVRGRREDFILNVDIKLQQTFDFSPGRLRVEIHGYNLLDFGNETLEYTFGNENGFDRAPLELQIPRSIMFQLSYLWH